MVGEKFIILDYSQMLMHGRQDQAICGGCIFWRVGDIAQAPPIGNCHVVRIPDHNLLPYEETLANEFCGRGRWKVYGYEPIEAN